MCLSCFSNIPAITLQLVGTSAALLYGQRSLFSDSKSKWTRRITLGSTVLVSLVLSGIGLFLLVLATNDEYRKRGFASFCMRQNTRPGPLDEHRCGILREGNVSGKVIEFGPGPGTNFKCFQNYTEDELESIEKYVAVEPNPYFEEEMRKEQEVRGLSFPLEIVGLKGEEVDISPGDQGSFNVVVLTHVLCSVDSVESVLSNAERALRPGGRVVFMEHVTAKEGTGTWYAQVVMAPIMKIVGNGCRFRYLRNDVQKYLGERFNLEVTEFDAPMPWFLRFVKPHIKGVATKK